MEDRASPESRANASRRQTLSTIAASSAVVSGLAGVPTTVVGTSGRKKRITILAAGDESRETVRVSKRWYKHTEQAAKVKEAISNRMAGERAVHSIGIENGDESIGGLRSDRVVTSVLPSASQQTRDAVPSSVEGIPVRTEESEPPEQTDCYTGPTYDGDDDPDEDIYGGRGATGLKEQDGEYVSVESPTLCCRAYKNDTKYIMGCRHMFNGDNCDGGDITDRKWGRVNDSGEVTPMGDVVHAYQVFDAALMDISAPNYREILSDVADQYGGVVGRVTQDGVEYLQSQSTTVSKRGRSTCKTTGTIHKRGVDYYKCSELNPFPTERRQIVTTANQEDGDSGGPVYHQPGDTIDPDELYLLHIATRKTNEDGWARGSSAAFMNDEQNITFGPKKYSDG